MLCPLNHRSDMINISLLAELPFSFLSSLLTWFCLIIASTFSCLLFTHGVSYLMVTVHCLFLCMSFDFLLPLQLLTQCMLCIQTPLERESVYSLLIPVLLSRDFKSCHLTRHWPDFSFGGRCPLVIQSAVLRAGQYTRLQGDVGAAGFLPKHLFSRLSDLKCFDFNCEIPLRITISSTRYWQTYGT